MTGLSTSKGKHHNPYHSVVTLQDKIFNIMNRCNAECVCVCPFKGECVEAAPEGTDGLTGVVKLV